MSNKLKFCECKEPNIQTDVLGGTKFCMKCASPIKQQDSVKVDVINFGCATRPYHNFASSHTYKLLCDKAFYQLSELYSKKITPEIVIISEQIHENLKREIPSVFSWTYPKIEIFHGLRIIVSPSLNPEEIIVK